MINQIETMKETVAGKIDEPEFNWLDVTPIALEEGIMIHYTPRCKSTLISNFL